MLTVHHLQCSQSERIVWLCEELSIPYTLRLHKRDPIFSPPELKNLTPLGAAPVIIDDSEEEMKPLILAESGAVVEYIIHKHGGGRLALSPSHNDYAQYLYWFHLANANLQPCIFRAMQAGSLQQDPEHPVRRNADQRLKMVLELFDARLRLVPWLAGEEFSAADIMNVFSLTTMRMFFPMDLGPYPGIMAWLRRVGERPAYRRAMEKGDPDMPPCLDAGAPPLFPALVVARNQ